MMVCPVCNGITGGMINTTQLKVTCACSDSKPKPRVIPYEFTTDWFSPLTPSWQLALAPLVGKPDVRCLEVGTFEGRSALWLVDNILTGKGSKLTCVDTWQDTDEQPGVDMAEVRARFKRNVEACPNREHFDFPYQGALPAFLIARGWLDGFDFIYIDGSHRAADVLTDSVFAWQMLKVGGLLCWDDLSWRRDGGPDWDIPARAVASFRECFHGRFETVVTGNAGQNWIRKVRA